MDNFCKCCGCIWQSEIYKVHCPKCKSLCWMIGHNNKCKICDRLFLILCLHHIDGNHKNNSLDNHLYVCAGCHSAIHGGIAIKGKIRFNKFLIGYGMGTEVKNKRIKAKNGGVQRRLKYYQSKLL